MGLMISGSQVVRKLLPHIVAIITFLAVNCIYFYPQLEGEITQQGDIVSAKAMVGELSELGEITGDRYYWNNSMFSGMPWYLLNYGSHLNTSRHFRKVFELFTKAPIGFFFEGMICCYLVLVLLGVNPWLGAAGSIAFALNTNFLVLWEAGHYNKVLVLVLFPLVVGGLLLTLRKKWFLGGALFALGLSLTIGGGHIQMVYYMAMLLVLFYIIYAAIAYKTMGLQNLLKASGVLLTAALLAAASNAGPLYSAKAFSDNTMRGEPILQSEGLKKEATSSSEVKGLEWNYAMNWSNGGADLWSLLIPRAVGGSSAEEMSTSTEVGRLLRQNGSPIGSDGTVQAPMYWGPLPFTSGPYYLGALVIMLFTLSVLQFSPPLRWALISAVLFCLLLSMGKHAEWLNRPLFDHLPMYSKFRAPNSIMNVMALIVTIPALIGLQKWLKVPDKDEAIKRLYQAAGITGGLIILGLLMLITADFTGPADGRYPETVREILINARKSVLKTDFLRSLAFVLLGGGLLWAHAKNILSSQNIMYASLGALMVIDLWGIDRRYMDSDNFLPESQYDKNFEPRPVDRQIKSMEPKGRGYYRVHDLSINTFNSSMTSQHHNTIGGYYAAKLQRYQDLIDFHISRGNPQVLNMLNTKYVISSEGQLQTNPNALGNAWFVSQIEEAGSPREEIEALSRINTATTASVLTSEFSEAMAGFVPGTGAGQIEMTDYEPDHLIYKSSSTEENLAVFSEVWYGPNKGWTATIDGEEVPILRVNYILRALRVPPGDHEIVFAFTPQLPALFRILTFGGGLIIFLGFIGIAGWEGYQWIQKEDEPKEVKSNQASAKRRVKGKRRK